MHLSTSTAAKAEAGQVDASQLPLAISVNECISIHLTAYGADIAIDIFCSLNCGKSRKITIGNWLDALHFLFTHFARA